MSHDDRSRSCETRTNIVNRYLKSEYQECTRAFLECCLKAQEMGFTGMKVSRTGTQVSDLARTGGERQPEMDFIPIEEEDFFEKSATDRSDFRETWLSEDHTIGLNGQKTVNVSLPHSITTWVLQAVSVSPSHGVCVAHPQKIVSTKKVFLQLNLPYSVVRNEQVEIQATLFNYGQKKLAAVVYMYGLKSLCTGAQEGEKSEHKRLIVEKQSAASVTFPVIPLEAGQFSLRVVAISPEGSDVIVRKLNVVPEGYPTEISIPVRLDPTNQQKRRKRQIVSNQYSDSIDPSQNLQVTTIKLPLPTDFVPGTESCSIVVLGDQMGPVVETALNDPEKLLRKPLGCGEQNMMFLAPTLYAMRYLKFVGKITPEIEEKGYAFIRDGYSNQLSFRKNDGSYAAFTFREPSAWLTAFTVKVFCQAVEMVHIDRDVICSGVYWLINQQQPDGAFVENNPVYHIDMVGGVKGKTPMTAFVLIALEECKTCEIENLHIVKKRAESFLEEHLGDVNEPLEVAVVAYALSLSNSALKVAANQKLLSLQIYDEDTNTRYWGGGNSAKDVEATSYALLNQILLGELSTSNSIVNWLNSQQLQSGCFKSTQDTVMALQGLSEYAMRAQVPSINLKTNITSSNERNFHKSLAINEENAHILQDVKVNKLGGMLFINTVGHGVGSLLVKMRYNILHPAEKMCKFDVIVNVTEKKKETQRVPLFPHNNGKHDVFDLFPNDLIRGVKDALNATEEIPVAAVDPRNRGRMASLVADPKRDFGKIRVKREDKMENSKLMLNISICSRYLGNESVGMSIVDVGVFSGFEANEDDLKKLQNDHNHLIEKYDKSNKGIVFYLKTVPSTEAYCFDFLVTRKFIVGNTQMSTVQVYDYYNPDEMCTVFYSPGNNSPLLKTICDSGSRICQCAEGGCPPKNPFMSIENNSVEDMKDKLIEMACEKYDFVWMGKLDGEIKKENGFYNISFKIDTVIKEGTEKASLLEEDSRFFLAKDVCDSAVLIPDQPYLIMGIDGLPYRNENDDLWYRYLLDKKSVIHMWTPRKAAKNRELQRALDRAMKKLKTEGCEL